MMKKLLMALSTILLIACGNSSSGDDFTYVPSNAKPGALYTMKIGELGDCSHGDTYNELIRKCPEAKKPNNYEVWKCVSIETISSVLADKYDNNMEAVKIRVDNIADHYRTPNGSFGYGDIDGAESWVYVTECK